MGEYRERVREKDRQSEWASRVEELNESRVECEYREYRERVSRERVSRESVEREYRERQRE